MTALLIPAFMFVFFTTIPIWGPRAAGLAARLFRQFPT